MKKQFKNKIFKLLFYLEILKMYFNVQKKLTKKIKIVDNNEVVLPEIIEETEEKKLTEIYTGVFEVTQEEEVVTEVVEDDEKELATEIYTEEFEVLPNAEVVTEIIDVGGKEFETEIYEYVMSDPYYDMKEFNKLWKIVKKAREENKDNPNYPHISTLQFKNGKFYVYLKIGDYESWDTPLVDAYLNNKNNPLFMNEFKFLLKIFDENNTITINTVLKAAKLKYKEMYGKVVEFEIFEDNTCPFVTFTFIDDKNNSKNKNV